KETPTDEWLSMALPEADKTCDWVIDNKSYTITLKKKDTEEDSVTAGKSAETKISKQKSLRRNNHGDFELVVWEKSSANVDETYVNTYAPRNSKGEAGKVYTAVSAPTYTPVVAGDVRVNGCYNATGSLKLELAGRYNSEAMNADGGSLEIVQYNPANGFAYAVSGVKGKLIAVNMNGSLGGNTVVALDGTEYDLKTMVHVDGFTYGDMTSVAISPDGTKLAAALQDADYAKPGIVTLFACKADGSLELLCAAYVGVQPDMVTFADNQTILTADEGEPRNGVDGIDPKGSVSIVTVHADNILLSHSVYFDSFDDKRGELTDAGVLVQKGANPSADFEPEYIAVSGDTAYVSLQEANAIAVLDIASKAFTGVYPLGFQDYSMTKVDLQKNDAIEFSNYDNVYGIKMPDGISVATVGGKTYLLTANEGDSRADWNGLDNEYESDISPTGNVTLDKKTVWFNADLWDGLNPDKAYVFGGRSFSIYEVANNGLKPVYDSGSDFETITAKELPDYFNCSNDKITRDNRSGKKGPEPETVITGTVDGKTYAFIALERIGGIMVYDITDPSHATFVNYINSREFDDAIQGDVSPEGMCFVSGRDSKTGNALLLAACEVSGTLAVYELTPAHSGSQNTGSGSHISAVSSDYPVSVISADHGTVTASHPSAAKGTAVTLTIESDEGYTPETVTVTDGSGNKIKLAEKDGKYTFTMPASQVSVEVTFKVAFKEDTAVPNFFADVSADAYYYDAVLWVVKNGITDGTSDTTFSPDALCTRAQLVTFLWRAAGSPTSQAYENPFADVMSDAYYYDAVAWAKQNGIVNGVTENAFAPDDNITREQIAAIMLRYAKYKNCDVRVGENTNILSYTDAESVSAYAIPAVQYAVGSGLMKGKSETTINPLDYATRAEIATILQRFFEANTPDLSDNA
ncbi:MAG: choice-of-anchor I family protein, partial [Eubacteriales bacterium]